MSSHRERLNTVGIGTILIILLNQFELSNIGMSAWVLFMVFWMFCLLFGDD